MASSEGIHPIFLQENPWNRNANTIWLATSIQLLRNLEKFKFPYRMSGAKAKQIISLLNKEFLSTKTLKSPKLFLTEEIGVVEKEFLVEHFLTTKSFQQHHIGEAFLLDESGTFFMTINIHDHFALQLTDSSEDIEKAWERLVKIESSLGKVVNFAFTPQYGFLTSNPMQCGTGMLASLFLQPTALIHTGVLEEMLAKHFDENVYVTGLQGDPEQFIGDVVTLHNQYTLGVTEESIISSLRTVAMKLIAEESTLRNTLKTEENADLKDQVSRAYGMLTLSYQTETLEAMDAIALLKLGVDLGWVTGIKLEELNKLFFNCRRAHLVRNFKEEVSSEELLHKRAEYLHKHLKGVELKI